MGRKEVPQSLISSGKSKLTTFSYVKTIPPYHKAEILKIVPLQYQMAGLFLEHHPRCRSLAYMSDKLL